MSEWDLKIRTKQYSLRIVRVTEALPNNRLGRTVANQLIRCGTSVAANYRAVCRAQSKAAFIAKISIVIEEADECAFWLELIIETGLLPESKIKPLLQETNEIVAIMVASKNSVSGYKKHS